MELTVLEQYPPQLLDIPATELHTLLAGPTLIHIAGDTQPALFVSVLLHGNETTGWEAVRALLKHYQGKTLPRSLSLFIGNVSAARYGQRRLSGQQDYNRVWPTPTNQGSTPEHKLVKKVFDIMRERGVFMSVDIHNNTGLNPHYACVNRLDGEFAYIAHLFSKIVIHFTYPDGVQSHAFAQICPAVTIECGQIGFQHGISHAQEYLEKCLQLNDLSSVADPEDEIVFYENFATVTVADGVRFRFDNTDIDIDSDGAEPDDAADAGEVDVLFFPELDKYNFTELAMGTPIAQVKADNGRYLDVTSNDGEDLSDEFFHIKDGVLLTRKRLMPSMFSTDAVIVRKDCLCYLMGRILT